MESSKCSIVLVQVCPGGWVYYQVTVPAGYNSLRFSVTKYEGEVSFIARTDERPVTMHKQNRATNGRASVCI
jgi:hypothetical protein